MRVQKDRNEPGNCWLGDQGKPSKYGCSLYMHLQTPNMTAKLYPCLLPSCLSSFTSERGANEHLYLNRDTFERIIYTMTNGHTFAQTRATLPPGTTIIPLDLPEDYTTEKFNEVREYYRYWCRNICK